MSDHAGSGDLPIRLDLYVEEQVLATAEPRRVREAGIGFGRPTAHALPPGWAAGPDLLPAGAGRNRLLLRFPFQLGALSPNRRYESASVFVDFADDEVTAVDIRPVQASPPTDETPRIDVRGIGRHRLEWDIRSADGGGLRPRSHVMQVVLDAPAAVTELGGTLSATAVITRQRLGAFDRRVAAPLAPEPFTLGPVTPAPAPATAPTDPPGPVKVAIGRRLGSGWKELADYVGVRRDERDAFEHGREAAEVWDWLERHGRLGDLPAALRGIGRPDLADLVDDRPPGG